MTTNEIKVAIDNEAVNLENNGCVFFQGEIPYDLADGNETYEVDGDEVVKVGVFLTKDVATPRETGCYLSHKWEITVSGFVATSSLAAHKLMRSPWMLSGNLRGRNLR